MSPCQRSTSYPTGVCISWCSLTDWRETEGRWSGRRAGTGTSRPSATPPCACHSARLCFSFLLCCFVPRFSSRPYFVWICLGAGRECFQHAPSQVRGSPPSRVGRRCAPPFFTALSTASWRNSTPSPAPRSPLRPCNLTHAHTQYTHIRTPLHDPHLSPRDHGILHSTAGPVPIPAHPHAIPPAR
jgi:hypothetical protein